MRRKTNSSSKESVRETKGILSDWVNKREKKYSDKICLFGKSFNYGTDDPLAVSIIAIVLRATWLALGVFLYVYYNIQPGCKQQHRPEVLSTALCGLLVYHCTGLVSALVCMVFSLFGTLIRPKPRRPVIGILHFLFLLYLAEFPWLVYSTYVCFSPALQKPDECKAFKNVANLFYAATGSAWLVYLVIVVALTIDTDPCGHCSIMTLWRELRNNLSSEDPENKVRNQSCCGPCTDQFESLSARTAMADVVRAMGVIFGDFSTTFSDLRAGFMLVGLHQRGLHFQGKSAEFELSKATVALLKHSDALPTDYLTPSPVPLTKTEVKEMSAKCLRYIKYSFASYGGVSSLGSSTVESYRVLCKATRGCVCCPRRLAKFEIEGESQFTNATMISAAISLHQDCIVACSFSNAVYEAPYFATYNPDNCELIVAVQGSSSVQDVLTNMSLHSCKVPGLGGIEKAYVHRGFYKTALTVYNNLLNTENFMDVLQYRKVNKFLFTGHSLGASVATILSILFKDNYKNTPWEDKIETLGFNVPASTMNYALAEKVQSFVTSIVAPRDVVSRLTLRSVGYFKIMAEAMLVTVDCHKQQALCCSDSKWYQCCPPKLSCEEEFVGLSAWVNDQENSQHGKTSESQETQPLLENPSKRLKDSSTDHNLVNEFLYNLNYQRSLAWENPEQPMLFVPGKILHLEVPIQYRTSNPGCCAKNGVIKGSWKARESLSTILVHPDMLEDHRLVSMFNLLQRMK